MLDAVSGHELEERINPELMQSVIEITTPVCRTVADVSRELVRLRGYVTEIANGKGLRVGSPERTRSASSSASGSRRRTGIGR